MFGSTGLSGIVAAPSIAAQRPKLAPDSLVITPLRWTRFTLRDWNNSEVTSLVLGSAQWGEAYGLTNARGRLSDDDLREIVDMARARSVTAVDTAPGYGDAESRLRPFASDFAITTKVNGAGEVTASIEASLTNLQVTALEAVLVHDWESLNAEQQLHAARELSAAVESGLVRRVGASVYGADGIEAARDAFDSAQGFLGALQVPANPIDRRLDGSESLQELRDAGTHITVRSAFLQGVLLADSARWSSHPDVRAFQDYAAGTAGLEACLGHVRGLPWATHVVIGVTSAAELVEVCDAWQECESGLLPARLGSTDLDLIDPRRW